MINNNNNAIIILDSCEELGKKIAEKLDGHLIRIKCKFSKFGNSEINLFPCDSVRGKKVFIVGSGSNTNATVNDNIMAMLGMIRACRDASADQITLVCTYFPYARSDKKDQGRAPIMGKLVCDLFKEAGAFRIITFDLHSAQVQGFFNGPFDNLYAGKDLIKCIKSDYPNDKFIVISPDVGGLKRIQDFSCQLNNAEYTFLVKSRDHNEISCITSHELVHKLKLENVVCVLVDDIGDTFGTLNSAAEILRKNGATKVITAITHGVFSGNALNNLNNNNIDQVYVTNTLPQTCNCEKIKLVDVSNTCANALLCCINSVSISTLFDIN